MLRIQVTLSARATLILLAVAACGTPPDTGSFGAQPIMTLTSKNQLLSIAVRTAPQPPTRGNQMAEYTIVQTRGGQPASGLTLHVVPWMPAHQHGASIVPSVSETRPGTYVISNVDFFMAGVWELRTTLTSPGGESGADAGALSDYVAPSFEIP